MVEVKKDTVDIVILQSINVHFLRPTAPLFSCRIITSITKPGKAKARTPESTQFNYICASLCEATFAEPDDGWTGIVADELTRRLLRSASLSRNALETRTLEDFR